MKCMAKSCYMIMVRVFLPEQESRFTATTCVILERCQKNETNHERGLGRTCIGITQTIPLPRSVTCNFDVRTDVSFAWLHLRKWNKRRWMSGNHCITPVRPSNLRVRLQRISMFRMVIWGKHILGEIACTEMRGLASHKIATDCLCG